MDYEFSEYTPTREDQTESLKCDTLDDELDKLKDQLFDLARKFEKIDKKKLDKEEHDYWNSEQLFELVRNIDNACDMIEGVYI